MIWTYRVFCDEQGRYSLREVFYERDGKIIDYGKAPVTFQIPTRLIGLFEAANSEIESTPTGYKDRYSRESTQQERRRCKLISQKGNRCRVELLN